MNRKRSTPEHIITQQREAKVALSQSMGMKNLERENTRLKKVVADLILYKLVLKKALEENY